MTVPSLSTTFMGFTAFLCIGTPFIFWLVVREKVQFRQAAFGLVLYFVFVILIKQQLDAIVLAEGAAINGNKLQYILYTVFASAIFEEGTKYLFFKFYLSKKYERAASAVGFGMGFAAFATFFVGVIAISNFALALTINQVGAQEMLANSTPENADALKDMIEGLCTADPIGFLMEGINKFFFIISQIAMSVIVWYAAKGDDGAYLLPGAVILHAAFSVPTALFQFDGSLGLVKSSLVYCAMIAATALYAYWLFRKKEPVYYDFKPDRLQARKRR